MPRRKKGRAIDGWLLIDKPLGVGSTQIVGKARWVLNAQKAGHAGTLDPLATGLLAVALGEATKTIPYAMGGLKRYRFIVRWGAATATDDLEGDVVARADTRPSRREIEAVLPDFIGDVMQRPPAYSAIKVDGARAYDLARDGEIVELAARPIHIAELKLLETPAEDTAAFELVCGKGGYVRSVARDLGERLGCLGHVVDLRRLAAGPFQLDDAISFDLLEELRDRERPECALRPVAAGLDDIPALPVSRSEAVLLRQGRSVPVTGDVASSDLSNGEAAWARLEDVPVAVGVVQDGDFRPKRVFNFGASDVDARIT